MITDYNQLTVPEATRIQRTLGERLNLRPIGHVIRLIAGADISCSKESTTVFAGIVVFHYPSLRPVQCALASMDITFPYVPGYLAFREVPPLATAWDMLATKPDVLVLDGHGIAHPRRVGVATHFGLLFDVPTIGCAKTLLYGQYKQPELERGAVEPLLDKQEQLGWVLRSKKNATPIFVSPGHRVALAESLNIIRQCLGNYRIPEPTRLAHEFVNQLRKGSMEPGTYQLEKQLSELRTQANSLKPIDDEQSQNK